ncbi:hypothetical protein [Butyrivibrio sp. MC2013]|uniref:hypothetical protein n=1 Tax=Butyrivibrio sp. MC2013 TaxID=1280686 RepID=UPI00040035E7|nr:hypothetical protein [Butyrivibrio sp. MC2013]
MITITIISTIIHWILFFFIALIKGCAGLVWKIWKLLYCFLPISSLVLVILIILETAGFVTGKEYIPSDIDILAAIHASAESPSSTILQDFGDNIEETISESKGTLTDKISEEIEQTAQDIADKAAESLARKVTLWWKALIMNTGSKIRQILLVVLSIALGIPIIIATLISSAVVSGQKFLALSFMADLILYLIMTLFTMRAPWEQFGRRRRYMFDLPFRSKVDPKLDSEYADWLKRHKGEFQD